MRQSLVRKSILLCCTLLAACTSSTCPEDTVGYLTKPFPPEIAGEVLEPQIIEIGYQDILVDEVIQGPLCNDSWSGTVYVTCDIQIPSWEEESLFFQDCDLKIAEGAVVYVEAHGNQPYFEGCSCHE